MIICKNTKNFEQRDQIARQPLIFLIQIILVMDRKAKI